MTSVLQVNVSKDRFQQFNIIENDGNGDCLFLALLDFIKRSKINIGLNPSSADDLRLLAANYLLTIDDDEQQLNFDRFKDELILNLHDHVPSIANYGLHRNGDVEIERSYWEYMTTPGTYGTYVELCAIAEQFEFAGNVIQRNDTNTC